MQTKLKFLGTWILGSLTVIAGCDKNPVGGTDPLDSTQTLVQAVIYTPQASSHYSESILTQLKKELVECGLNSSGSPDCLDTQFVPSYSLYRSMKSETEDTKTSVGFIDTKDQSASFILVLEQSKSVPRVFLSAGLYFAGSSKSHDLATVINDYADGKLEKIADLTIPQADEQSLLALLSTETNYRRLYHLSENLLHKRDPSIKGKVLASLKNHFLPLTESNDPVYQYAFLDLLRDSLNQDPTFLVTVSKELLSSSNDGVSKLAAITLAERGTVDAMIQNKVRSAIVGDDTALVLAAIPALALIRQGLPDEILVILAMDKEGHAGYGYGITTAAEKAISTFTLTDSHVPALTQILGSYNSTVRLNAVNHLGAIQTSLSTSSLIGALLLSDSAVQARAKTFLEQRTLTNQELQLLTSQTSNKVASIRDTAIELIERIQTKESNAFLVGLALQMLQDIHSYIREDAISILGKVNSTEATNDLIIALFDSDETVVNAAIGQLKNRVLTDDQIPSLQQVLGSIHGNIRDLAIPLLGKILTDKATTVLIPLLEDPDARVAQDTNQQLQLRTFNSDQVILLARVLGASNASIRKEAAFLLGNANDAVSGKKAYDLLNATVKIETDYQVILEMKRSAILLQAKYGLM